MPRYSANRGKSTRGAFEVLEDDHRLREEVVGADDGGGTRDEGMEDEG